MENNKLEVVRQYAKYLFLDVVQFSKRSAEAQSEIVQQLNEIVIQALASNGVEIFDCILIPTGDGMCIALTNNRKMQYDLHIQIALSIIDLLNSYNKITENTSRQFQVRIGINQNTDILITDINKNENIAGAGINMASRIMDKADGGQILLSQTVYEELQPSERYMNHFTSFEAKGKHNISFRVYQYIDSNYAGLNCVTPTEFLPKTTSDAKLSMKAAFYIAHSIKHKQFIISNQKYGREPFTLCILLWIMAIDSEGASMSTEISPYIPIIYGDGKLDISDVFKYYNSMDFQFISMLSDFISCELGEFVDCLCYGRQSTSLIFVTEKGKNKLKSEWPDIWSEFELDKFT